MERLKLIHDFAKAQETPEALLAVRPVFQHAKVKLTDNCNSKCITCDYWKSHHENELTLEEFQSVLDQLRQLGIEEVMFTGGEPTMRAELVPVIQHAAKLGFSSIALTTNGLSLNHAKIDQLLNGGLHHIVLSLEGVESHDEIRGVPGNTRKILAALEHLSVRRAAGARVGVKLAMTLMERTLEEIEAMLDLARAYHVVLFFNLMDRGTYFFQEAPAELMVIQDRRKFEQAIDKLIRVKGQEPALISNTVSSLEYARRYFDDPKQAGIPCHLGYIGVDIDANGDVYSNCWGLPPVGNVRSMPLASLLAQPAYLNRCRAMFRKECPGCSCGYILNLAYHKPSVAIDERSGCDAATSSIGYAGTHS